MLTKLNLGHLPSFQQDATVNNLEAINFIFGPNGSGKTSITRALASGEVTTYPFLQWHNPDETLEVCSYNRDYVATILHSSTSMPGVFALGGDSAAALQRIDVLSADKGAIAKARKIVDGMNRQLTGSTVKPGPQSRLEAANTSFENKAWDVRQSLPAEVRTLLSGNIGTKRLFAQRVLAEETADASRVSQVDKTEPHAENEPGQDFQNFLDDMATSVKSLNEVDNSSDEVVPQPTLFDLADHDAFSLFSTPVVSTSDTPLARALRQRGSIDWAVQGIEHLDDTDSCPMCFQSLNAPLLESILGLSDEQYARETLQIAEFSDICSRKQGVLSI